MNRHQVLTGAVNAGDHCYAVGSVEGVSFTAYAAGCDIVILASNFERVQIIPGVCHGNIQIGCLDCSTDSGKIAAAYGYQVCIFEPTPLSRQTSTHKLDYRWVQTCDFKADCFVRNLSWNLEGTRLLTGGMCIQMWQYNNPRDNIEENGSDVHFDISNGGLKDEKEAQWSCIWQCKTAHPVAYLKFSQDGTLFASAGKMDRLVKIWYETKAVNFPAKSIDTQSSICADEVSFTFIYIAHPRAVTGLSWRKTSKYMPRGSVANMLVTSCKDNICRIWVQTILPDDGLVNMQQFDPLAAQNPKYRTHRQKHKFMMRLKHIKTCFHFRRRQATHHQHNGQPNSPIPTLPSTFSSHDFHSFGVHGSGITPGFHFHLATSINAETDIPLVPSISASGDVQEPNFVLHWLNNKEMHFTLHAEHILQDLSKKALEQESKQASSEDNELNEGVEATVAEGEVEEAISKNGHVKNEKKKHKQLRGFRTAAFNKSKSIDDTDDSQPPANSAYSLSSTNSTFSLNVDPSMAATSPIGDALDRKIEALLRDWHSSPDLLFSIHPVDGSFLVWLVDWLDEYIPGSFRQAQVSFSSRIPNALPLGDAMTMSTNLALYNCQTYLDLKSVLKLGDVKSTCGKDFGAAPNTPVICMLSKHKNGSLNLWNITFNDNSKFTQVLSVGHISRVCGHRFRVNDISCHPVLPLLLTTSHHNVQRNVALNSNNYMEGEMHKSESIEDVMSVGFCSELILWRVDPVGPLCRSGGVTELARINSPEISAFSNIAWIPTLLPSTTLGSLSNSPSACFVASDGHSLRIYQAVIDARNLLAEIFTAERRMKRHNVSVSSLSSSSSFEMGSKRPVLQDAFKIVSQQSTARPGCIIQLDAFAEADHDWHNTQFLHVFQEQLITGEKDGKAPVSGLMENALGAMVDLQQSVAFEEPFYLVVLVKDANSDTILHMWKIIIASHLNTAESIKHVTYAPDSHLVQDSDHSNPSSRGNTPDPSTLEPNSQNASHPLSITTTKVCTQRLSLPANVEIIHAAPAAGHLSSSSIYPACFAPYLITTACSDSKVRFWYCRYKTNGVPSFTWAEWEMLNTMDESSIDIPGVPLNVSCAYSGRFACAYKSGRSFTRPSSENPNSRFVNLCVAIYECESTGGSEWILEDTIHLKNISLPEIKLDLDFSYLHDKSLLEKKKQSLDTLVRSLSHEDMLSPTQCDEYCYPNLKGLVAVPSFSTLQTLRKAISEKGNQCILTQKHLVQLDWVSTEDGSHVLTVGVGSKILLFTTVSSDLAQANIKTMSESKASSRPPVLTKASSMMVPHFNPEEIRWMKLRSVELSSADGLPPLPMQISWVRDGILVVGMDNEMHVYCQWRDTAAVDDACVSENIKKTKTDFETSIDSRNLTDKDIITIAQDGAQVRIPSLAVADAKKKRELIAKGVPSDTSTAQSFMPDYGLFEASRMACPVLPQYHPKQLMELLNFGKIRRVKAILVHLVRCLSGAEARTAVRRSDSSVNSSRQRAWSRSRTLSISIPQGSSPMDTQTQSTILSEELHLDYVEINAIPPLPLYTLLAADKETIAATAKETHAKDYGSLFASDLTFDNDDDIENILAEEDDTATPLERRRSVSVERQGLTNFGTRQARTLTRLLTHTHLPGLSSLDQMHLLALADTVASCNTAFADRFQIDAAIKPDGTALSSNPESLDDCGLRFLLAMRHHLYLMRCLPPQQRIMLHKQGLNAATLVWAFHSESEEELVNVIPGMQKGTPKWAEFKELGAGWWIRNNAVLKRCIEKVAKAAFQARSDPLDAALWYLAMKKKNLVWGLFRSVRDDKMTTFFQNNFLENRWRKAALKNAFILLGKQRFTHAAAFFLLAGSLWDAIEVCLNKLNDLQLAMVIVRLYEGELDATPPGLKKLLYEEILGYDKDGNSDDLSRAHPDPFLRSMAYWILKDYSNALGTLLQTDVGGDYSKLSEDDSKLEDTGSRNAFNFYVYLRTHPLLIRQHIADSAQGKQTVLLTGFAGSTSSKKISIRNKQVFFEDAITPLERRLYFMTAHAHFKAGCPALALEVLSKLPSKVIDAFDRQSVTSNSPARSATPSALRNISTGTINENGTDWGTSMSTPKKQQDDVFDWGQPTFNPLLNDEPLKLDLGDDENNDYIENETEPSMEGSPNPSMIPDEPVKLDIMAQQLKFIACLKIVMEELSTLATGFEVDGGQLRYQLYIWIEREVEALKELCNYSGACSETRSKSAPSMAGTNPEEAEKNHTNTASSKEVGEKPTLHEILLADKMDFEAKLERAEKRKRWLKANETLLRTLLSYCSLHGASGGGLASVRMELILLLQELQQEKTQQQLLSPLPFPTTLPLLSASVACHKTVITDPIRHLQAMAHDILCCIIDLPSPGIPGCVSYPKVFVLRDLCTALSACIYQSLCDSDSFSVKHNGYLSAGMEALASTSVVYQESHLMAGCGKRRRLSSSDEPLQPTTPPNKWPGVTSLRALLAQEKDDDTPKLSVLLCEAFIAVYMSLLIQALSSAESHTLYRLMGQMFNEQTWSALFGGGVKKLLKVAVGSSTNTSQPAAESETSHSEAGLLDTLVKQRMKLHMKILGQFGQGSQPPVIKEDRPTYREQFVPPEMSMASYFMTKPTLGNEFSTIDYDSNDSLPSEEELEDELSDEDDYLSLKDRTSRIEEPCTEHSDPSSYSWGIMRYAIIRLAQHHVQKFLNIAGLELQEMPVASPLIHSILKIFDQWLNVLKDHMESYGYPPQDYIPTCFVESGTTGPAIQKYKSILDPQNTPFKSRQNSVYPVRRLWCFLVHQEHVQDIFVRYIFGKKRSFPLVEDGNSDDVDGEHSVPDPIKIIHKDQDSISAFCINMANNGVMALATTKEVQELDISVLLEPPLWLEDNCEYDILNLNRSPENLPASEYLVIQTAADRPLLAQIAPLSVSGGQAPSYQPSSTVVNMPSTFTVQTGRSTTVLMKHKVDGVRRMNSHPVLPLYLTGCQDGSVKIWEWGHNQPVALPRAPGTYAKVTRVLFNPQGNKFGISDGDGNLSLWQVGLSSNANKMFFSHQVHGKQTSDFVFVGSSSLIATAGHSSESKNVCMWDTLLPQKKSMVQAFICHDQGCSCLVYAPQHQIIISGGKKGEIFILDVRQKQVRQRFAGHDSPIKCITLDPNEEFFVTGSADGDIKVWGLIYHNAFFTFQGEHMRNTFFRNISVGVSQLYVDTANRLFSCGADGSMKLRQLPERELVVHSIY